MPVTRLNYFTAKPGQADALAKFLLEVIDVVRGAEGCLGCRLLRDQRNANEFVIVEAWTTMAAHQQAATMIPKERIASVMVYLASPPRGEYLEAVRDAPSH